MNKFKNGNKLLFKPLLLEFSRDEEKDRVLYTIKDHDVTLSSGRVVPSLKRLYIEESDITEYSFATKYFLDLDHWERLTDMYWFKNIVREWRRELELSIRSKALKALVSLAENTTISDSNPTKASINKYLVEGGWRASREDKRKGSKTRITKEEVMDSTSSKESSSRISDDYNRILSPKEVN